MVKCRLATHAKEGGLHLGEVPVGASTGEGLVYNDGVLWLHSSDNCTHASGRESACMQSLSADWDQAGADAMNVMLLADEG